MASYWNRDYREEIIRFLEPVTGPIETEYLRNGDGSVAIEELQGDPNEVVFVDGGRIARYDFNLYVRTHGRDTASRKRAADTLMAAARKCASDAPFPRARMIMTEFPSLFNRNMSGNEEYRARFSLYFPMNPEEVEE